MLLLPQSPPVLRRWADYTPGEIRVRLCDGSIVPLSVAVYGGLPNRRGGDWVDASCPLGSAADVR